MYLFNVRVYGLLINEHDEILISDEQEHGFRFSKFPGGGLEYGEGLIEGLQREFIEECNAEIEVVEHFYTTDFFVKSIFNESQVLSVYYLVKPKSSFQLNYKQDVFDFDGDAEVLQSFRLRKISDLTEDDVTFPTDKKVIELLKNKWKNNL